MVRRIGMAVIAAVVALVVINRNRLMTRLRGAAAPAVATATEKLGAASPGSAATAGGPSGEMTLPAMRKALKTSIGEGQRDETPAPEPPAGELEKVTYDAPLGKNAYVTPVKPGPKRPAIVWIHGGFSWGIDDGTWTPGPRSNDQSAIGFRKAGIAELYPRCAAAARTRATRSASSARSTTCWPRQTSSRSAPTSIPGGSTSAATAPAG